MIEATPGDKPLVVDLLARAFNDNQSVNYLIPQDGLRAERIRRLIGYSFERCHRFGKVYLASEGKACALVLFPDQQKTTLASVLLDLKLITSSIGLTHLRKALSRESVLKKRRPREPLYYLWFIGVAPGEQGKGVGSALLRDLIKEAGVLNRTLCLETSTTKNLPWYEREGFTRYDALDLGYTIHFFKRPSLK